MTLSKYECGPEYESVFLQHQIRMKSLAHRFRSSIVFLPTETPRSPQCPFRIMAMGENHVVIKYW